MSYDIFSGVYNLQNVDTAYASNGVRGILKLYNECNYYQCFILYHNKCISYSEMLLFIVECARDEKAAMIMENMIGSTLGLFDKEETDVMHDNAQILIDMLSELAQNEGAQLLNILDLYKNKLYISYIADRYKYAFTVDVLTYLIGINTACDYIDVIKDKPYLQDISDLEMILTTILDEWEQDVIEGCIFEGNEDYIERVKNELGSTLTYLHNTIVHFFEDNNSNTEEYINSILEMVKYRVSRVLQDTMFNTSPIICCRGVMELELYLPNIKTTCQHGIENYNTSWMNEIVSTIITNICTVDSKMYQKHYDTYKVTDFMDLIEDIRNTEHCYSNMCSTIAMLEVYADRTERSDGLLENQTTLDNYLNIYYVMKDRILFVETGEYDIYRELSTGDNIDDFTNELNALDDIMDWLV